MVRRLPPLNALRAFEAAARLGSFARAGEELAVTATAISHQVKSLEEYLGVVLFDRLPRGLRLTAMGRAYLPELTHGFDQLARAAERLHESELRGLLTVSVLPSFGQRWLVPRLGDFRRRFPEIDVRIQATPRNADFVREGVDVGVRYGVGQYPGLRTRLLMTEEVFPAASPTLLGGAGGLRDWGDLARHTLLHDYTGREDEQWITWRPWLAQAGLATLDLMRGLFYDDSAMMVEAAVQGQGVMIARSALVSDALRDGRLVALFGVRRPADYAYYVVTPEAVADQPRIRAFVDWAVEAARVDQTAAAAG